MVAVYGADGVLERGVELGDAGLARGIEEGAGRTLAYPEFVAQVCRGIEERAQEGVRVDVNRILKNNLDPVDGLTILHDGENVAQAIWLGPLYRRHEYGVPADRIAEEIWEYHEQSSRPGRCDLSFYTDFAQVRDRIVCKLIHRGMNEALLGEVPHREFLDLAVVYYYKVEDPRFGNASILVKKDHLKLWQTDAGTLDAFAVKNTPRLLPCVFTDIVEMMEQMGEGDTELCLSQEIPMFVLTNQEKTFGAATLLFPEVLEQVESRLHGDFFILPSSIHECIVIPALEGIKPSSLHEMVQEINQEHVVREEQLGSSVYVYRHRDRKVSIAYQGA